MNAMQTAALERLEAVQTRFPYERLAAWIEEVRSGAGTTGATPA